MMKLFGVGLAVMAMAGFAATATAADSPSYYGKWSTWGCQNTWFELGNNKITRFGVEGGNASPQSVTYSRKANITDQDGKVKVSYKYRSLNDEYIYDMKGHNKMQLDKLLVDGNTVFNRAESNSPYRDKLTTRCSGNV